MPEITPEFTRNRMRPLTASNRIINDSLLKDLPIFQQLLQLRG